MNTREVHEFVGGSIDAFPDICDKCGRGASDPIHLPTIQQPQLNTRDRSRYFRGVETQHSISVWAAQAFGPTSSNARVAARANEEMAELLRALTVDDNNPKAGEEIADIVMILYRLCDRMGLDLHQLIDQKMEINRTRTWKHDGSGHGYHVRDKEHA
jgi:NTP pyrophosphatase (non-canonical NTP hydrolase)